MLPTLLGSRKRYKSFRNGNFCNGLIVNAQNYQTGPANFQCTPISSPWGKFVVDAPKNDFAPRIGLAWDPFKKGTTSVRLGYGIYHEQVLNGTLLQQIGVNPPYQQTCTVTGIDMSDPSNGCTVASSNLVSSPRGIQADWVTPYMQHWSLDVQHQVAPRTLLTVGYYGSKGTNLIGAFELNSLLRDMRCHWAAPVAAVELPQRQLHGVMNPEPPFMVVPLRRSWIRSVPIADIGL